MVLHSALGAAGKHNLNPNFASKRIRGSKQKKLEDPNFSEPTLFYLRLLERTKVSSA
jgi:hypothetical protein